ncbi:unnamed protein product [Sympodiomycopsis kandeliae]
MSAETSDLSQRGLLNSTFNSVKGAVRGCCSEPSLSSDAGSSNHANIPQHTSSHLNSSARPSRDAVVNPKPGDRPNISRTSQLLNTYTAPPNLKPARYIRPPRENAAYNGSQAPPSGPSSSLHSSGTAHSSFTSSGSYGPPTYPLRTDFYSTSPESSFSSSPAASPPQPLRIDSPQMSSKATSLDDQRKGKTASLPSTNSVRFSFDGGPRGGETSGTKHTPRGLLGSAYNSVKGVVKGCCSSGSGTRTASTAISSPNSHSASPQHSQPQHGKAPSADPNPSASLSPSTSGVKPSRASELLKSYTHPPRPPKRPSRLPPPPLKLRLYRNGQWLSPASGPSSLSHSASGSSVTSSTSGSSAQHGFTSSPSMHGASSPASPASSHDLPAARPLRIGSPHSSSGTPSPGTPGKGKTLASLVNTSSSEGSSPERKPYSSTGAGPSGTRHSPRGLFNSAFHSVKGAVKGCCSGPKASVGSDTSSSHRPSTVPSSSPQAQRPSASHSSPNSSSHVSPNPNDSGRPGRASQLLNTYTAPPKLKPAKPVAPPRKMVVCHDGRNCFTPPSGPSSKLGSSAHSSFPSSGSGGRSYYLDPGSYSTSPEASPDAWRRPLRINSPSPSSSAAVSAGSKGKGKTVAGPSTSSSSSTASPERKPATAAGTSATRHSPRGLVGSTMKTVKKAAKGCFSGSCTGPKAGAESHSDAPNHQAEAVPSRASSSSPEHGSTSADEGPSRASQLLNTYTNPPKAKPARPAQRPTKTIVCHGGLACFTPPSGLSSKLHSDSSVNSSFSSSGSDGRGAYLAPRPYSTSPESSSASPARPLRIESPGSMSPSAKPRGKGKAILAPSSTSSSSISPKRRPGAVAGPSETKYSPRGLKSALSSVKNAVKGCCSGPHAGAQTVTTSHSNSPDRSQSQPQKVPIRTSTPEPSRTSTSSLSRSSLTPADVKSSRASQLLSTYTNPPKTKPARRPLPAMKTVVCHDGWNCVTPPSSPSSNWHSDSATRSSFTTSGSEGRGNYLSPGRFSTSPEMSPGALRRPLRIGSPHSSSASSSPERGKGKAILAPSTMSSSSTSPDRKPGAVAGPSGTQHSPRGLLSSALTSVKKAAKGCCSAGSGSRTNSMNGAGGSRQSSPSNGLQSQRAPHPSSGPAHSSTPGDAKPSRASELLNTHTNPPKLKKPAQAQPPMKTHVCHDGSNCVTPASGPSSKLHSDSSAHSSFTSSGPDFRGYYLAPNSHSTSPTSTPASPGVLRIASSHSSDSSSSPEPQGKGKAIAPPSSTSSSSISPKRRPNADAGPSGTKHSPRGLAKSTFSSVKNVVTGCCTSSSTSGPAPSASAKSESGTPSHPPNNASPKVATSIDRVSRILNTYTNPPKIKEAKPMPPGQRPFKTVFAEMMRADKHPASGPSSESHSDGSRHSSFSSSGPSFWHPEQHSTSPSVSPNSAHASPSDTHAGVAPRPLRIGSPGTSQGTAASSVPLEGKGKSTVHSKIATSGGSSSSSSPGHLAGPSGTHPSPRGLAQSAFKSAKSKIKGCCSSSSRTHSTAGSVPESGAGSSSHDQAGAIRPPVHSLQPPRLPSRVGHVTSEPTARPVAGLQRSDRWVAAALEGEDVHRSPSSGPSSKWRSDTSSHSSSTSSSSPRSTHRYSSSPPPTKATGASSTHSAVTAAPLRIGHPQSAQPSESAASTKEKGKAVATSKTTSTSNSDSDSPGKKASPGAGIGGAKHSPRGLAISALQSVKNAATACCSSGPKANVGSDTTSSHPSSIAQPLSPQTHSLSTPSSSTRLAVPHQVHVPHAPSSSSSTSIASHDSSWTPENKGSSFTSSGPSSWQPHDYSTSPSLRPASPHSSSDSSFGMVQFGRPRTFATPGSIKKVLSPASITSSSSSGCPSLKTPSSSAGAGPSGTKSFRRSILKTAFSSIKGAVKGCCSSPTKTSVSSGSNGSSRNDLIHATSSSSSASLPPQHGAAVGSHSPVPSHPRFDTSSSESSSHRAVPQSSPHSSDRQLFRSPSGSAPSSPLSTGKAGSSFTSSGPTRHDLWSYSTSPSRSGSPSHQGTSGTDRPFVATQGPLRIHSPKSHSFGSTSSSSSAVSGKGKAPATNHSSSSSGNPYSPGRTTGVGPSGTSHSPRGVIVERRSISATQDNPRDSSKSSESSVDFRRRGCCQSTPKSKPLSSPPRLTSPASPIQSTPVLTPHHSPVHVHRPPSPSAAAITNRPVIRPTLHRDPSVRGPFPASPSSTPSSSMGGSSKLGTSSSLSSSAGDPRRPLWTTTSASSGHPSPEIQSGVLRIHTPQGSPSRTIGGPVSSSSSSSSSPVRGHAGAGPSGATNLPRRLNAEVETTRRGLFKNMKSAVTGCCSSPTSVSPSASSHHGEAIPPLSTHHPTAPPADTSATRPGDSLARTNPVAVRPDTPRPSPPRPPRRPAILLGYLPKDGLSSSLGSSPTDRGSSKNSSPSSPDRQYWAISTPVSPASRHSGTSHDFSPPSGDKDKGKTASSFGGSSGGAGPSGTKPSRRGLVKSVKNSFKGCCSPPSTHHDTSAPSSPHPVVGNPRISPGTSSRLDEHFEHLGPPSLSFGRGSSRTLSHSGTFSPSSGPSSHYWAESTPPSPASLASPGRLASQPPSPKQMSNSALQIHSPTHSTKGKGKMVASSSSSAPGSPSRAGPSGTKHERSPRQVSKEAEHHRRGLFKSVKSAVTGCCSSSATVKTSSSGPSSHTGVSPHGNSPSASAAPFHGSSPTGESPHWHMIAHSGVHGWSTSSSGSYNGYPNGVGNGHAEGHAGPLPAPPGSGPSSSLGGSSSGRCKSSSSFSSSGPRPYAAHDTSTSPSPAAAAAAAAATAAGRLSRVNVVKGRWPIVNARPLRIGSPVAPVQHMTQTPSPPARGKKVVSPLTLSDSSSSGRWAPMGAGSSAAAGDNAADGKGKAVIVADSSGSGGSGSSVERRPFRGARGSGYHSA